MHAARACATSQNAPPVDLPQRSYSMVLLHVKVSAASRTHLLR
jgi:hypothetical protein